MIVIKGNECAAGSFDNEIKLEGSQRDESLKLRLRNRGTVTCSDGCLLQGTAMRSLLVYEFCSWGIVRESENKARKLIYFAKLYSTDNELVWQVS